MGILLPNQRNALAKTASGEATEEWYQYFSQVNLLFTAAGVLKPAAGGTGVANALTSTITLAGALVIATHGGTIAFPGIGTTMTMPATSKTLMATDFSNAPGAGGDLSGTYPNPTVAKIKGAGLGTTTATSGHILVADGADWQSVAVSGDASLSSAGVLSVTAKYGSKSQANILNINSTSAAGTMLGLAGAITPTTSGTVYFSIAGTARHATAGGSFNYQLYYGTGAAPASGAALTGTAVGIKLGGQSSTANNKEPFSNIAIVTGLVVGTPYWFDIALDNGGAGTATVDGALMCALEL